RLLASEKPRLPRGNLPVIAAVAILALAAAVSVATAYDRLLTLGVVLQLALLVLFVLACAELLVQFPMRPLLAVLAVVVVSQALLAIWQAATQSTAPAEALFNDWPREATSHSRDAAAGGLVRCGPLWGGGNLGALVERNSIETRLSSYTVTWKVIGARISVGAGNHVLVEQRFFGGGGPAHDVFLIVLAELGPLGLLGWLSIFGSLLLLAWRRRDGPAARTGPLVAIATLSPLLLFD